MKKLLITPALLNVEETELYLILIGMGIMKRLQIVKIATK
jgi:hypothetical protein